MSTADMIKSSIWFRRLSKTSVDLLGGAAHVRRIKNNQLWVSRSDVAPGLAIVLQGGLRTVVVAETGRSHTMSILRRGSVWGAISVVDGKPTIHDVYGYGATKILLIERSAVRRAVAHPDVSMAIMQIFAYRLHKTYALLDDHTLRPLETRLARFLLTLKPEDDDQPRRHGPAVVRITQEEVANAIGCTRPTVNQKLKLFEAEGLLERTYGGLRLLDRPALQALCHVDEVFDS